MRVLLASLIATLSVMGASAAHPASPQAGPLSAPVAWPRLAVPYLPQTPALCGGAAVAMVFRYWGERHADVQQFAPLVDERAGGIANTVLVEAVRKRRWKALELRGSLGLLSDRLAAAQPAILLIEDRPGRFHYVVAVGIDGTHVYLHDPTWGPSRPYPVSALLERWERAGFWTLVVLPEGPSNAADTSRASPLPQGEVNVEAATSPCARLLDEAITEIGSRGLGAGDALLAQAAISCPEESGPFRELAGVRFAQRRWTDAEVLAQQALTRDRSDRHAWDLLGSSRFMRDDHLGALSAWNRAGKPLVDSVTIDALSHTRYALVARSLGLEPNTLLTREGFRRAERRLQALPTRGAATLRYRPGDDGFAVVDVAIAERSRQPRGRVQWGAAAARALATREVVVRVPGWLGQGEVWSAGWRWWEARPRVQLAFAAPRVGWWPGVWRVEAVLERESYHAGGEDALTRERRARGTLSVADWLSADLRYEVSTGIEVWNQSTRTVSFGGALERRWLNDRLGLSGSVDGWLPIAGGDGFGITSLQAAVRSSTASEGVIVLLNGGVERATGLAPPGVWPGAGEGQARPALLRAHPLLDGKGIASGPVIGRGLIHQTSEIQRWLDRPRIARVAFATFVDVAWAFDRVDGAVGKPFHIDAGAGLRLRVPGAEGVVRVDYAYGLRDGSRTMTAGWQVWP
jgi:hypothetical protein